MKIIKTVQEMNAFAADLKRAGKKIGFVPTMGNLHDGHLSLVARAKQAAEVVGVSVFVNPIQFNNAQDLEKYPRTLEADIEKLRQAKADFLFAPEYTEIYPQNEGITYIEVLPLSNKLEGKSRPGHFRGVATVVGKLFNIVKPDIAVFGEKDFQQVLVIKQMVKNLNFDVQIISQPTRRAESGLALSSRNNLLSEEQRDTARFIYRSLQQTAQMLKTGAAAEKLKASAIDFLTAQGFTEIEIDIRNAENLAELTVGSRKAVILIAAKLGGVRLIDNLVTSIK